MEGPYPSLEAYCDARGKKDRQVCPSDPIDDRDKPTLKPGGPWCDARIFISEGYVGAPCHFAVRTERGWFVRPNALNCYAPESGFYEGTLAVGELVGGEPPELTLRASLTHREFEERCCTDDGESYGKFYDQDREELLIGCGLGPSKTPSCFQLTVALRPSGGVADPLWELSLSYQDGAVEVKDAGKGPLTSEAKAYLGKHPLRFP
jgi:hypothetical protein